MILIFGIGNPLRQDDGAGWVLAERLAAALRLLDCPSRVLCVQQLAPESAVDIAAADVTIVCFADVSVDAPGVQLAPLEVAGEAEPARLTHEIGPRTLLAYAATLRTVLPHGWLVTVGGQNFDHGEDLSDAARAALADAGTLQAIARRIANGDSSKPPSQ